MPSNDNDHRFAALDGIATLYKFRTYSTDELRHQVREILIDHKVYFARASQLNDKRDLRPLLRVRGSSEAKTRKLLLDDAEKVWARHVPSYSPEELSKMRQSFVTKPLKQFEAEARKRAHDRLEENYWVLSLSASRDYVAMWNDYADRGRGLCIHFRSDALSPFGFAQRVLYRKSAPTLLVPLGTNRQVADASVLTKLRRWRFEREYRLIRYPDLDLSEVHMRFEGQHAQFPRWALTGITVGFEMPPNHVREILDLAEAHDPPLRVWRPNSIIEGPLAD